jgi:hypothetical protein
MVTLLVGSAFGLSMPVADLMPEMSRFPVQTNHAR